MQRIIVQCCKKIYFFELFSGYLSPRPPAAGGECRKRQQGKRAGGGLGNLVHVEVDHQADVFAVFVNGGECAARTKALAR